MLPCEGWRGTDRKGEGERGRDRRRGVWEDTDIQGRGSERVGERHRGRDTQRKETETEEVPGWGRVGCSPSDTDIPAPRWQLTGGITAQLSYCTDT